MESVGRNSFLCITTLRKALSLSAWRAWVEIGLFGKLLTGFYTSLSAWRAWVEMLPTKVFPKPISRSLSAWRAWVEIIVDSR